MDKIKSLNMKNQKNQCGNMQMNIGVMICEMLEGKTHVGTPNAIQVQVVISGDADACLKALNQVGRCSDGTSLHTGLSGHGLIIRLTPRLGKWKITNQICNIESNQFNIFLWGEQN